ncbi:MAG: hypothetical protein BGO34_03365 [Bacteroidia bacterium 44-10]|nr:MAG: hypothetical protein BGO34_03365 [Bacteroidia bacterium 44-10]
MFRGDSALSNGLEDMINQQRMEEWKTKVLSRILLFTFVLQMLVRKLILILFDWSMRFTIKWQCMFSRFSEHSLQK